jgi:hypothetical protein
MASRLVLVLGMHRSGTSVTAAGLTCLGVSLGDRLVGTGPDNPAGFWENGDVLDIDAGVLAALGIDWQVTTPISREALRSSDLWPFGTAARLELTDQLSRFPLLGVKDPRLCRLLPFWRPIFQRIGCEVGAVFAVRDPASVAQSLLTRDRIPIADGRALWLRYVLDSFLDADPGWPKVVVDHERMMKDPVAQLRRIGAALDLTLDEAGAERFSRTFVDRQLWHARAADAVDDRIGEVWKLCQEAAEDRLDVDALRARLRELGRAG